MEVADWLKSLGLAQYAQVFSDNEIDSSLLPSLTGDDLKEMGIALVGHRRKLLDAVAALRPSPGEMDPTSKAGGFETEPTHSPPQKSATADRLADTTAERRQLTVMFVDLVDSTKMSTRLDPEDMRRVITIYQNAVAGEISRFEGLVAKFMGDGVLAYFGWPRTHEDEAERAVRAGLAIVSAVTELHGGSEQLACRVGIATGLVVVGDLVGEGAAQEQAVVGETPNLAARLQGIARPGQVVVSGTTRRLLGSLFEVVDLGPQILKGIEPATSAFVIRSEINSESRFAARAGG